jgi:hypothetical protein
LAPSWHWFEAFIEAHTAAVAKAIVLVLPAAAAAISAAAFSANVVISAITASELAHECLGVPVTITLAAALLFLGCCPVPFIIATPAAVTTAVV